MRRDFPVIVPILVLGILVMGILTAVFVHKYRTGNKKNETYQTKIVIPHTPQSGGSERNRRIGISGVNDELRVKVPMKETEIVIAVLTDSFDRSNREEQFIAYRNSAEIDGPVYISFIAYDENSNYYRQVWTESTAATVAGTVSLFTEDIIGDRSLCVFISGMNNQGEHTLSAFKKNKVTGTGTQRNYQEVFTKIAELSFDGPININKTDRSQAYQMGMADGTSYSISAFSRDPASSNIMDQLEYYYTYDSMLNLYTESAVRKIPGIQIEQQKLRELLGKKEAFEDFITGLWYYVSPQGTIDNRQYIYFNPINKEIIFYGDETQQVFTWQNSTVTRYGLYLTSQNISVTTLKRYIDINLETLESINIKVIEGLRLKFGVNAPWDGSYRKAGLLKTVNTARASENLFIDTVYDSPIGRFFFLPGNDFIIISADSKINGKFSGVFINDSEILELRYFDSNGNPTQKKESYLVTNGNINVVSLHLTPDKNTITNRKNLLLEKIRIGAHGIQKLHEGVITFNLAE